MLPIHLCTCVFVFLHYAYINVCVCIYNIYIFYIIILMHRGGGWLLVGQGVLILPNVSLYQPKTNQPFTTLTEHLELGGKKVQAVF